MTKQGPRYPGGMVRGSRVPQFNAANREYVEAANRAHQELDWRQVVALLQQLADRDPRQFRVADNYAKAILLAHHEEIYG